MTYNFLTVMDLELMAAQLIKAILVLLLFFGAGLNIYKAFKTSCQRRKVLRWSFSLFFLLAAIPVIRWTQIDGSLLSSSEYTEGTTTGFCSVFARGRGIRYEYVVAGK